MNQDELDLTTRVCPQKMTRPSPRDWPRARKRHGETIVLCHRKKAKMVFWLPVKNCIFFLRHHNNNKQMDVQTIWVGWNCAKSLRPQILWARLICRSPAILSKPPAFLLYLWRSSVCLCVWLFVCYDAIWSKMKDSIWSPGALIQGPHSINGSSR